jgi:hypothetical protein
MAARPERPARDVLRQALALLILGDLALLGPAARAGEDTSGSTLEPARLQFFEREVRPLLAEHCYSCHGPAKQKGSLRLDSLEAILKGGETGPSVVPGKPAESLLVEAINYEGPEMPPSGKLEPKKIAVLTRWVALGTPWPKPTAALEPHGRAAVPGTPGPPAGPSKPPLWSLQPLRSTGDAWKDGAALPTAGEPWGDWARTPIDGFILARLLEHGLTPAPEADRRTLIRRLSFDLTGLPPTPEEIAAFLADDHPDAYERLVDRLLATPRYGQRWGRHWLDLVRYAESDGYRQDAYRPAAWRYRDYVVRSFNADKPYDRFLTEQLAGDEVDPEDLELRVATGFLRLGTYEFNQRNVSGQWADILNDITDVTGEAILGLSVGCARCHDHKFDPILQRDYYRLQAFFAPLLPRDDLLLATAEQRADFQARQSAWEAATESIRGEIASIEQPHRERAARGAIAKFPTEIQGLFDKPESERTPQEVQLAALAYRQVALEHDKEPVLTGQEQSRREALRKRLTTFDHLRPAPLPEVMAATDVGPTAPPTFIPGARRAGSVEPGFLSALDPAPAPIDLLPGPPAVKSTGRRLALARWLCQDDHPLTARVIVNRVWQQHFGRGLVATSSDFGHLGEAPTHPELLDWLARRLVVDGWRLKPLHRLIVMSAAYRQSAQRSESEVETARRVDPENRLVWKRTILRLDAEEIRDALLAVSGELPPTLGGPSADSSQRRRAIDTKVFRNSRDPLLDVFDAPDGYASAGRRVTTTTANQALLLSNGTWSLDRARALAGGLGHSRDPIARAFELAYSRPPSAEEQAEAAAFLEAQARRASGPAPRKGHEALIDFCHALLNSNEFLYVD